MATHGDKLCITHLIEGLSTLSYLFLYLLHTTNIIVNYTFFALVAANHGFFIPFSIVPF